MKASPGYRRFISKQEITDCMCGQQRMLPETNDLLRKLSLNVDGIDDLMKYQSMISISPKLSEFPMIDVHSCGYVYSVFRCDPIHTCSAGTSPSLKNCVSLLLNDDMWKTSNLTTKKG